MTTLIDFLTFLVPFALAATLIVLLVGVVAMARGGPFHARNSNRLMRLRVICQGFAVLLLFVLMLLNAG